MQVLIGGAVPHRVMLAENPSASNLQAMGPDSRLQHCEVAFGQPDPRQVIDLPNVKWVHLTSAGYTRYDTDEFREAMRSRDGVFSNSSSVYAQPCAEHALAMMMALSRQLSQALDDQRGDHRWPSSQLRSSSRRLNGQSILIYGYGAIARHLVKMLQPFGMHITGVRRQPRGDEGIAIVTSQQADALLPHTDHVMNILPASVETETFFDADRLKRLSPTAYFYNIGRGSTVDQDALQKALESGRIAGAYLDVMTPEPLPPEHPLWRLSNCWITPHAAGGHRDENQRLIQHFLQNLKLYAAGQAVVDQIGRV